MRRTVAALSVSNMQAWDVVVVGSGVAALRCAIAAADAGASVTILCPGALDSPQQAPMLSGFATSMGEVSSKAHFSDTISVGADLCEPQIVARFANSAVDHLAELERWGLVLRRDTNGLPLLSHLPGHSIARVANTGDSTDREIRSILEEQCTKRNIPRRADIETLEIVISDGCARGVVVLDVASGEIFAVQAKSVVLAGAGYEGAWGEAVNLSSPALAKAAGISLADLEFNTRHPLFVSDTGVAIPMDVLAAGGELRTAAGDVLEIGDISSSDSICAAIDAAGGAILNANNLSRDTVPWFAGLAATLSERCGIDMATESIAVETGVAHTIGGIPTDGNGQVVNGDWDSVIPGLFAAGDAACSGFHGAASSCGNRLLDAIAGGENAGSNAAAHATAVKFAASRILSKSAKAATERMNSTLSNSNGGVGYGAVHTVLTSAMNTHMGGIRDATGLAVAAAVIADLRSTEISLSDTSSVMNTEYVAAHRLTGLLAVCAATVAAAISREESRGSHVRSDHPDTSSNFDHHSLTSPEGEVSNLTLRT
jgi:succinate dehydrogenase / fumarate reductase flavoprotein subunit